jgi:hypothetical protein
MQTHRLMGVMKYAVEMGSGAMIYIPSFIKTCSHKPTFLNKDSRVNINRTFYAQYISSANHSVSEMPKIAIVTKQLRCAQTDVSSTYLTLSFPRIINTGLT